MAVDLSAKSLSELQQMAENYRAKQLTDAPLYKAILELISTQEKGGLSFEKTIRLVTRAAKEGRFLSYGEIAAESGLPTGMARITVPKHLLELNKHAKCQGWPMLSAIVVTQEHLEDGLMDEVTLAGFCRCATALGEVVTDNRNYLKAQQGAVFAAAKEGRFG
jgi:hypothetical protein